MRLIFGAIACATLTGCGDSAQTRRNTATAQVNVVCRELGELVGKDGYFKRLTDVGQTDPWGNRLLVEYKRSGLRESLTVRSCGEDGLPYTRDDIVAHQELDSEKLRAALRKDRQIATDGYGAAVGHGLTRGVSEAIRESREKKKQ